MSPSSDDNKLISYECPKMEFHDAMRDAKISSRLQQLCEKFQGWLDIQIKVLYSALVRMKIFLT